MAPDNRLKAIFWMILCALFFTCAMSVAKSLPQSLNPVTIVFSRSMAGALFLLPLLAKNGWNSSFKTSRLSLHLLRVLIISCATGLTYYAYRSLPLATASAIGLTSPLFTTLLAIIFLREQFGWKKWTSLLLGYAGVLLMIKPGGDSPFFLEVGILAALGANFLGATGIILIKQLTRTDSSETILLYGTYGLLMLSGIAAFWFWQPLTPLNMVFLGGVGALGLSSQYAYIQALKNAPASFVTPFEYLRLCFMIPIGYFFFNETPDFSSIVGSLIIILSITLITRTS